MYSIKEPVVKSKHTPAKTTPESTAVFGISRENVRSRKYEIQKIIL